MEERDPHVVGQREQVAIVVSGGLALALTIGVYAAALSISVDAAWQSDRFALGAVCAGAAALALLPCVLRVALFRFFSDADRPGEGLAPTPGRRLRVLRAITQNTLEQTVLAALGYFAFTAAAPADALMLAPASVALFLLGRLAFAIGYAHGASGRAFGFVITMLPTAMLYGLTALALASQL
jgi:hypothetical protein